MRPPQNAGGIMDVEPFIASASVASMRPPQNAGGIRVYLFTTRGVWVASMRPPQNAGGIFAVAGIALASRCFNEAPAKRGGDWRIRSTR